MANNCTFSIIIPVLHEPKNINLLLEDLQQFEGNFEIIVVEGNPKRETIANIRNKDIKILCYRLKRWQNGVSYIILLLRTTKTKCHCEERDSSNDIVSIENSSLRGALAIPHAKVRDKLSNLYKKFHNMLHNV